MVKDRVGQKMDGLDGMKEIGTCRRLDGIKASSYSSVRGDKEQSL